MDSAEEEARMLAEEYGLDNIYQQEAAAMAEFERKKKAAEERELAQRREEIARRKAHAYGLSVASVAVKKMVDEELASTGFTPTTYVDPELKELPFVERRDQVRPCQG